MMTVTLTTSTHDDGQRRSTVLVQGQPVIAETTDHDRAERTAREVFSREKRRTRAVRLIAWNGDTATETVIIDGDGRELPPGPIADFARALNPGNALALDVPFILQPLSPHPPRRQPRDPQPDLFSEATP